MTLRKKLERLPFERWTDGSVSISPILTENDMIYATYDCELTDEQKDIVNPAWFSIGRAYLNRDDNYPCLIRSERGEPIGFINLCAWIGDEPAYSWSYYIDKNSQGNGYGKQAARLAIEILKAADPKMPIKLAATAQNIKAQTLYESLGFTRLDELDGDDLVFGL